MSIPSDVLINWSKPGKSDNSKITYEKLGSVINSKLYDNHELFLQGSYHNTTHVKENSDIDVVVLNKNIVINNTLYGLQGNLEDLKNWKSSLFYKIQGSQNFNFSLGNKTIKYSGNISYVPADIVPCGYYKSAVIGSQLGTILYDSYSRRYFINYPKQHYENGVLKSQQTNGNFKKAVRMFKNARNRAVKKGLLQNEDIAPSYFLECLIYNVPNSCFNGNEQDIFYNATRWLLQNKHIFSNMKCQNGIQKLFGYDDYNMLTYNKWSTSNAITFINAIANLWDNWGRL